MVMSCPLVLHQAYNHLALGSALGLSDYKPDIGLMAWHNLYIHVIQRAHEDIYVSITPDIYSMKIWFTVMVNC